MRGNALVKNRRYSKLRQLILQGEYFSDESMRERSPALYEQYIGKWQDFVPTSGSGEVFSTLFFLYYSGPSISVSPH